MFDFNDSFGLDLTILAEKITNEPTRTRGFLFVFQFSFSSRNSPEGEIQIKSSCAAPCRSCEWTGLRHSEHHKQEARTGPVSVSEPG